MSTRPKIKVLLTRFDIILEFLGYLFLIGFWIYLIIVYSEIPEIIPTHFDFTGNPDAYGSKSMIWSLPIIGTLLFALLTILNKYPHTFKYPVEITPENATNKYSRATRLLRIMKLLIAIMFSAIALESIFVAKSQNGFGIWFMPLSLGFIIVLLLVYFFAIRKELKSKNIDDH